MPNWVYANIDGLDVTVTGNGFIYVLGLDHNIYRHNGSMTWVQETFGGGITRTEGGADVRVYLINGERLFSL